MLTPNDFSSLCEVEYRLIEFQDYYEHIAKPFEWKFTKNDLSNLLAKISDTRELEIPAPALVPAYSQMLYA